MNMSGPDIRLTHRGVRLDASEVMPGITAIRVSNRTSRFLGMQVFLYLAGETLIDTGFSHAEFLVERVLADQEIGAILLTHNHEDHTGNTAALAQQHECPVYLRNSGLIWGEGVDRLPFYRRLCWGKVAPFEAVEMPERLNIGARNIRAVSTPGHSGTHTAFFDEPTGALFTGDLYVSSGASAVMRHENPYETIESLRRAADLEPSAMLGSHNQLLDPPAWALRRKADRMEEAAREVLRLSDSGVHPSEIAKRLFSGGRLRNLLTATLTTDEFSRGNFVRACIKHRKDKSGPSSGG